MPLQPHVAGPFVEAFEIAFGPDAPPSTRVLRLFLKLKIHHFLDLLFLRDSRGWDRLLPLGLLSFGHLAQLEERVIWPFYITFPN